MNRGLKRRLGTMTGILAGLILTFAASAQAEDSCGELTVGWIDWPPYQMVGENNDSSQPVGVDIQAAKKYLGALGCDLKFISKPWARLLKSMEEGQLDVLLGMSKTEERSKYATFSAPYRNETVWLFMRANQHDFDHFTGLKDIIGTKFRLGVSRNAYYGDEYLKLMEDPKFKSRVFQAIGGENFQMLMTDRVDGFLVDKETGKARIKEDGLVGDIVPHNHVQVDLGPVHIMFGKNSISRGLMDKLNAIIEKNVVIPQS
ncbi:transporter substrate-binding domain-containing protein [uncultured Kiloniella sp.]|uniref:substrate-binding periplasmic protein n=1 Tax=uncultured Kiloniella sp. TaxID=1133091 RepID=UPI00261B8866|nr:transporter substrate-binding domain-containing protein [uncultured Kiloniella sp.]